MFVAVLEQKGDGPFVNMQSGVYLGAGKVNGVSIDKWNVTSLDGSDWTVYYVSSSDPQTVIGILTNDHQLMVFKDWKNGADFPADTFTHPTTCTEGHDDDDASVSETVEEMNAMIARATRHLL